MNQYVLDIRNITKMDECFIQENYPDRFAKALTYYYREDYLRCIGAYLLLDRAIGHFKEYDVILSEKGKPEIVNKPHINYSHSGNYVCLITDDEKEVGIDIQFKDKKHSEEFIRDWTRKEAILKLTGEGMRVHTDDIDVSKDVIIYNGKSIILNTKKLENDYFISTAIYK